jgi:signal transduction histidine kinase
MRVMLVEAGRALSPRIRMLLNEAGIDVLSASRPDAPDVQPDVIALQFGECIQPVDRVRSQIPPLRPMVAFVSAVTPETARAADQLGLADLIDGAAAPNEILSRLRFAADDAQTDAFSDVGKYRRDERTWGSLALAQVVRAFGHEAVNELLLMDEYIEGVGSRRTPADARGFRKRGRDLVRSIRRLVVDLSDFARLVDVGGGSNPWVHAYALEAVLVGMCSSASGQGDTRIVVASRGVLFRIPRALLRQIVIPLTTNSMDALGRSSKGKIDVWIGAELLEQTIRVRVTDTGPGWPREPIELDAKFRSDRRFSTKGRGHGRGLRDVYRIVRSLGGEIHLEQANSRGAVVEIVIPWRVHAYS